MNIIKTILNGFIIGFITGLIGINVILYILGLAIIEDMSYKINIAFGILGAVMGSISGVITYWSIESEINEEEIIEAILNPRMQVLKDSDIEQEEQKKSIMFD